jgi:DNA helicase-2/ATP-dependent DNA helicase PcrA
MAAPGLRVRQRGYRCEWLAAKNDDAHWLSNENDAEVRALVLVHRMAAKRLGFPNIYSALNDKAPETLKGGLLDGTAWVLRPFVRYLLPLAAAARGGNDFEVMSALRQDCPLLTKERLAGQNAAQLLATLKENVDRLVAMFAEGSNATIREVIAFVHQNELAALDDRFIVYLDGTAGDDEEEDLEEGTRESTSINSFLDCAVTELLGYREYIEHQSPYATQQGVKGAEFQRVLVVLDDEESAYNQFSYGKFFGTTALWDTDRKNAAEGKDTIVARTRRLFYVCCSRAVHDLAVILFVPDPAGALAAVIAKGFFRREDIHSLDDLSAPQVAAAE